MGRTGSSEDAAGWQLAWYGPQLKLGLGGFGSVWDERAFLNTTRLVSLGQRSSGSRPPYPPRLPGAAILARGAAAGPTRATASSRHTRRAGPQATGRLDLFIGTRAALTWVPSPLPYALAEAKKVEENLRQHVRDAAGALVELLRVRRSKIGTAERAAANTDGNGRL